MRGFAHLSGVHVLGTSIWCDVARARAVCFVSRADAELGRGRKGRMLMTGRSAALRRALGLVSHEPLTPNYGRPFALGRARLELLPSGRVAGAAQLLIELGSWRGLYAAGVSPRALPGAEPAQVRACNELVVDAPEIGGRVDDLNDLATGPFAVEIDELASIFVLAERFSGDITLGQRLRRITRLVPGLDSARRGSTRRLTIEAAAAEGRLKIRMGRRATNERGVLALGLLPTVEELTGFAVDCGAERVHVRLPNRVDAGTSLRLAGAEALLAALRRRSIEAGLLAAPEQLSLFPH